MSHIHLDTVRLNENLLRALNQRDVASLTGGGVQINNGNVIPWRARHPQVCLHLAYILPVTDFPTPGFSPAPLLQDRTITSSWGSETVPQQCSSHVLTGTSVYEGCTHAVASSTSARRHLNWRNLSSSRCTPLAHGPERKWKPGK